VNSNDTFWISGGSCAIRKKCFEKIGEFDNLYDPFYWEDIDLSYRARKSGYKIKFNPESVVEHRHEEGSIKKHYNYEKIKFIAYRNQFIFIWKNITDNGLIMSHFIWLPYHFVTALLRFDTAFFSGFILALLKMPQILTKRGLQKMQYKKNDKELFFS
jgi:GT2 family glycosyltransferase